MKEIKQRIVKVLSEVLNIEPEKVSSGNEFTDLEKWDSLFHLNVVLGLEKEFDLRFDVTEVMMITSIDSAVELIRQKDS
jgi:acyl carrier protein